MMVRANKKVVQSSHNPTSYDYKTQLYYNKSGSFSTLADAKATSWMCVKCDKGFRTVGELYSHRDKVHSY